MKTPRYRLQMWADLKRRIPLYAIQGSIKPRQWVNLHRDGTPMLFDNRQDAMIALQALRDGGEPDLSMVRFKDLFADSTGVRSTTT